MRSLQEYLNEQFGESVSNKVLTSLAEAMENLGVFPEKGIRISEMYDLDTDYHYLFSNHNYIVYRFNDEQVVVLEMFDERQDFMNTLFGISGRSQESIEFWGE